jgi:hypothetical protein
MKKITCLFIVVFLCLLCVQASFATEERDVGLRYATACEESPDGLHHSCVKRAAYVFNTYNHNEMLFDGHEYECKYCHQTILMEGQPECGLPIGMYTTSDLGGYYYGFNYNFYLYGLFVNPYTLENESSTSLDGYVFSYN